jgi:hypothetical protein
MRSDPDLEGLRGRVRHVRVSQVSSVVGDRGESSYRSVRDVHLDRAGRVTEDRSDYSSGAINRTVYTYDSSGSLIEAADISTSLDGSASIGRRLWVYDATGRLIEERHVRADGTVVKTRQPIYTADGRRIEEGWFHSQNQAACAEMPTIGLNGSHMNFFCPRARFRRVVYGVRGEPIEITFTGRLGLTVGKVVFETDTVGRITALRAYGNVAAGGETVSTWPLPVRPVAIWLGHRVLNASARWSLVRRGDWLRLPRTFQWGPLWFEILTHYDAHGRRLEERTRAPFTSEATKMWKYDVDGRVVEVREINQAGELTELKEYAYQVDNSGNWVNRTVSAHRLPHTHEVVSETAERVIDYYA